MIQVSIPASVPLKEFDYNAEVDWYIKADDIVLKKGTTMNPQPPKKDAPPVK